MVKMNPTGQKAIYTTSPYFEHIKLTNAYIKDVKWQGNQGVMIASKEQQDYKLFLSDQTYLGKDNLKKSTQRKLHHIARYIVANLSKVGNKKWQIGYVYNLRHFH